MPPVTTTETAPAPPASIVVTPTPEGGPATAVPQVLPNATPHIALLLPLKSGNAYLEKAAEAVQEGFVAAYRFNPGTLPIRIYGLTDENNDVVSVYQSAVANGAQIVVGPLTRSGVQTLASRTSISVPTLALNYADDGVTADNLYFFGLAMESEARQVARMAIANDMFIASIVSDGSSLSNRLVQAFSDEWKKQGGQIAVVKTFTGDTSIFTDLPIGLNDMVFIAAPAQTARLFRPFLNAALPVYATSQVFNGNQNQMINFDLRDVQFVDMPWLLQPDDPVVMNYPRPDPPLGVDRERLYALGIDAYRLMQIIYDNRFASLPLNGVTGSVSLGPNHQFERKAIAAEFKQGMGITPSAYEALNAAKKH